MAKPRKVSSLIGRVMEADHGATRIIYERSKKTLFVELVNGSAWVELTEDVELPLVGRNSYYVKLTELKRQERFSIIWDCSDLGREKPETGTGFLFGKGAEKQARRRVDEQEETGAQSIGGRRHVGSGAIDGLKSDASSDVWQQEAKQTKAKSFRLTLEVLDKISREARTQDKKPMVFLRFTGIPEHMAVEDDWFIIPRDAFEDMNK